MGIFIKIGFNLLNSMKKILKIKDYHKRSFAAGFHYLFSTQSKLNKSDVAAIADVKPSAITYILNGYEDRFPSKKAQARIAGVFKVEVDHIVSIGERVLTGQPITFSFVGQLKPTPSDPEIKDFMDHFNFEEPSLKDLSSYEKEIIKICRTFENNERYLQDFYDIACDLFVSFQAEKIKKIRRK